MSSGLNLSFEELYTRAGLQQLDQAFLSFLADQDAVLFGNFLTARENPPSLSQKKESSLLLKVALFLENFLAPLFQVEDALLRFRKEAQNFPARSQVKRPPFNRGFLDLSLEPSEPREGFACLTPPPSSVEALQEAYGCLICHEREKDSCARGLGEKGDPSKVRKNAQGVSLAGCPLKQKISEMHALRQQGRMLGALAMVMIDNPLVPLSGLRICTDCEDACIFQNHKPIDTPAVETEILSSVLHLPWGVEIYSLLTRWNPLNIRHPLPKEPSGYRVLIAGLGPAGLTLAHYLMQEGHMVWGVDGAKIEPLGEEFSHTLISDVRAFWASLEERPPQGVGGVAEYGITARWDKNFLTVVRLALERRADCFFQGGIRLGSSLTPQEAFELGIDHIALCLGAGRPHVPPAVKALPQGLRMASDFLMALHVGAAFQENTTAALQIRLPVVVIGGGLTAIDAATEALAFYPRQVRKLREIEEAVTPSFAIEDAELLEEFRLHGAELEDLSPQETLRKLQRWGGMTVLYRRDMAASPSFRLNPREVNEALKQGVWFQENAVPLQILEDEEGAVSGILLESGAIVPAKTVLIATGTFPNAVIFEEFPELALDPRVSVWGDLDPRYQGSVVKAMASAKDGYGGVTESLRKHSASRLDSAPAAFFQRLRVLFDAQVEHVQKRESGNVVLTVRSVFAAQKEERGQFFKMQPWGKVGEGVALRVLHRDPVLSLLTFSVEEVGASTHQLSLLKPGEPVLLMGPLGDPLASNAIMEGLCELPSPMQCMMKQICAQCLQVLHDPETGETRMVYACQELYQPCAQMDPKSLAGRLRQNRVMERALWALSYQRA